jgi:hypothetical protein
VSARSLIVRNVRCLAALDFSHMSAVQAGASGQGVLAPATFLP